MKTLKELIEARKCRKGAPAGITEQGAFWLACDPIPIRMFGGDGVGQSRSVRRNFLVLCHYRNGEVKAVVNFHGWHQSDGVSDRLLHVIIIDCTTVEAVIAILKGITDENDGTEPVYSDDSQQNLTAALTGLGMVAYLPAPDECDSEGT